MAVTPDRLRQVERAEAALRGLGISGNLRVRHHGDLARVELDRPLVDAWVSGPAFETLAAAVRSAGFAQVEVDSKGFRSGSLNVLAGTGGGAALSGH